MAGASSYEPAQAEVLATNEFMIAGEKPDAGFSRAQHDTFLPHADATGTLYTTPSRHVGSDGRAHGYVLRVLGSTLVTARETPYAHTGTGTGVSWFAIDAFDDAALNKALAAAHASRTGALPPGVSVFTASKASRWARSHYLIVHGLDRVANAALLAHIAAKAPLSVEALAKSEPYTALMRASSALRTRVAHEYAARHGLKLLESASVGAEAPLANGEHATASIELAALASLDHGVPVYDVYDDAANTATARAGVLVYAGRLDDMVLYRGAVKATGSGVASRHFETPSEAVAHLNALATSTGHYYAGSGREPSLDAHSSASAAREHAARVHHSGALTGYNPLAEQRYNSDNDAQARATREQLGLAGIERHALTVLSAELPSPEPLALPLASLARAAAQTSAPTIAVEESGRLVQALVRRWPELVASGVLKPGARYGDELREHAGGTVALRTELVRVLAAAELGTEASE